MQILVPKVVIKVQDLGDKFLSCFLIFLIPDLKALVTLLPAVKRALVICVMIWQQRYTKHSHWINQMCIKGKVLGKLRASDLYLKLCIHDHGLGSQDQTLDFTPY